MKTFLSLLLLLLCLPLQATLLRSRENYQPIIDRKPFGEIGKMVDPTSTVTAAEEQKKKEEIAQKFRMCGVTDLPDGSRSIAFIDETTGTMESYLLAIGETKNGFTLISADYDREHATLKKDGVTFTLGLGQGLIDTPPETTADTADPPAPAVKKIEVRSTALPAAEPEAPRRGSAKARLLKRQADKAAAEQAKASAMQAEVARQLEAKKRREEIERIKKGLPPTQPITLTPEEDAELEAAGVFNQPQYNEAPKEEVLQENEPLLIDIQPQIIQ